jgi:glycosyltransferase involved in cell wall biosynthesis
MGSFFGRRSPSALFEAFASLLERRSDLKETVVLAFAGRESEGVRGWAAENGVEDNVVTLGYLDHRTALEHLMGADGALLLVSENLPALVSGKIYEYMASGKPVFALAPHEGEAAAYLRRYGRGVSVSSRSVPTVTDALESFIDFLPETALKGRPTFQLAFQREAIAGRLARLLDSLSI